MVADARLSVKSVFCNQRIKTLYARKKIDRTIVEKSVTMKRN